MLSAGHKGLFADRLDVGVAEAATPGQTISPTGPPGSARLVPWARVQWQNRNRTYDPGLGRYVQADPNAAGQTLLAWRCHGQGAIASVDGYELASRFADRPGLQGYLGASPWDRRDELGLFFAAALDWAGSDDTHHRDSFSMVDDIIAEHAGSAGGWMSRMQRQMGGVLLAGAETMPGLGTGISLYRIVTGQASWADWVGVGVPVVGGVAVKALQLIFKAHRASVMARRATRAAGALDDVSDMYRHVGRVGSYAEMKQLTTGWNHAIEAHHLIEQRFLPLFGLSKMDGPAVVLTLAEHQMLSKKLGAILKKGVDYTDKQVLEAYRQVYAGYAPEWWEAIQRAVQ